MIKTVAIMFLLALAFIAGWHFFMPIVGGIIALTVNAWAIMVATVVAICVAILLVFILTGTGILVLGIGIFIWILLAIILFPVFFPILVPLFLIFVFISYFRRRRNSKEGNDLPK